MQVRILFEPRDLWIGVYIKPSWWEMGILYHEIYICILPALPIQIVWSNANGNPFH